MRCTQIHAGRLGTRPGNARPPSLERFRTAFGSLLVILGSAKTNSSKHRTAILVDQRKPAPTLTNPKSPMGFGTTCNDRHLRHSVTTRRAEKIILLHTQCFGQFYPNQVPKIHSSKMPRYAYRCGLLNSIWSAKRPRGHTATKRACEHRSDRRNIYSDGFTYAPLAGTHPLPATFRLHPHARNPA